jgi:hypothetical protein
MIEPVRILEVADHSKFPLLQKGDWHGLIAESIDDWLQPEGHFLFGGKIFKRVVKRKLKWDLHNCDFTAESIECFFIPITDSYRIVRQLCNALVNPITFFSRHKAEPISFITGEKGLI